MSIRALFFLSTVTVMLSSCSKHIQEEEIISERALDFATSFFTFEFEKAVSYCVPESYKYVTFYASNLTGEDMKLLDSLGVAPTLAVSDVCYKENSADSVALVTCEAKNVFLFKNIGELGQKVDKMTFVLPLVKRNKEWFVKMEGLLQSGKRNRDRA